MNRTRRALLLLTSLLLAFVVSPARAQTQAHATANADPLLMLPASDVVIVVDHGRLWNEAIPRFLGANSAPLAKLMAEIEKFKAKTGVDPRSISRIVAGVRFLKPPDVKGKMDKKDIAVVIIGQGDFEAGRFVEAMRRAEKDKVREVQHGGQTIYTLDERPAGVTAEKPETETPAVAALDANTLAIGDLMQVRATVDAKAGTNRLDPALAALTARNSNALISLAGNVPPELTASFRPEVSRATGGSETEQAFGKFFDAVASIRQLYASVGMTPTGIDAVLGVRTDSTEKAQSLGDMLLGARQQYGVFIDDKVVRDLVTNMQITTEGDEVRLRAELPQTTIAMLLDKAKKADTAASTSAAPAKTPAAQTARPAPPSKKKTRRSTRRRKG